MRNKITDLLKGKKKKYIIILAIGVILLVMGNVSGSEKKSTATAPTAQKLNEEKLTKALESIDGAGKVTVFIRYKNDGAKQIAKQVKRTESGVELSPEAVSDDFYVLSVESPEITGVLITATGAADSAVKNRLLRGAKHALGVPYSVVTVEVGK